MPGFSDSAYRKNFELLKNELRSQLKNYQYVFTHSPWGEYGHEDHVQIFRAVQALQSELGFTLWFPNYCSNMTYSFMLEQLSSIDIRLGTFRTNKDLAAQLMELYQANDCWTWYEGYEWPDDETFNAWEPQPRRSGSEGKVFPTNLIRIEYSPSETANETWYRASRRVLGKLKRRLNHRG